MNALQQGVGIVVTQQDKVLLGLRTTPRPSQQRLEWELPGGKLALEETVEQAATRELFEETGLKLFNPHIFYLENMCIGSEAWHTYGVLGAAHKQPIAREAAHKQWTYFSLQELPSNIWEVSARIISSYQGLFHRK